MIVGGIDIGSLSTKTVIMEDGKIKGFSLILTSYDSEESAENSMELALRESNLSFDELEYIVATGYGRVNISFAQRTVSEISCHAKGNHYIFPNVRTVLDMGGQDCKAIRCDENGKVTNFIMNDKCAAGTGRYLERVAATLELKLDQIGPLSFQFKDGPLPISSSCVVFAEGDIINLIREGRHTNDILAGATEAIVGRMKGLLERVGLEESLCISGGVAKNIGVVKRLEEQIGLKAYLSPEPQIIGAIGAALFAAEKLKTKGASKVLNHASGK